MRQLFLKHYLCFTVLIVVMMSANLCFAEKYELSKEQQQFLIAILSQAQIRGANAPMLLQVATALQKPVTDPVQPKLEVVEAPAK